MSTALTTSERTRFDDLPFVHEGYLYIYEAPTVFEATVASMSDVPIYIGIATDTVTKGAFGDIKIGMTVELEDAGGNLRGRQRVRSISDPNIFTGRAPRSNFDGGLNPAEATVVKVYDEYRVWAKIPYISDAGVQYRDEQLYPGADEAQPPLANNDVPAVLLISEDGGAQVNAFDASLSRGIRSGSNPITYSWDFGDGTITVGTSTDVDPTVSFPVGDRYVDLTVTDNNGVSDTARILVCVVERSDLIPAQVTRRSRGINRNDFAIESPADLLSTSIREGAPLLYADNDSIGNFRSRFYGWLGDVSSRYPDPINGIGTVSIVCEDVGTRLRKLVSFPQVVKVAEDATGSWQFLPDVDIRVLIHHMWRWYSSALEVATLDIGTVVYSLPRLEVTGNTLFDQFDRLAQAIGHRVSIDMSGVIRIIADPVVLPTAAQKTEFSLPFERDVTVRTTLTETDYAEPGFTYTHVPRISWSRAKGIVAATTADGLRVVTCIAPSKTPGQGTTESSNTEQLVDATVGQDELNVRTGNRYASREDNPFGQLQIELAKSRGIFDPALMQVYKVELPATLKNRHRISDDDLWLLNNIDETFEPAEGIKLANGVFERITVGHPAQTVSQPPPPEVVDIIDQVTLEAFSTGQLTNLVDDDPIYNLDGLSANIVAILDNGKFAVTSNADDAGGAVTWSVYDHSGTIGTDVYAWCLKAGATAVSGWVTASNGVFYVQNAQAASPTFTDQTPAGETTYTGIDADYISNPGQVVVISGTDGTLDALYVSTDAGSTWTQQTGYGQRASHNVVVDSVNPGVVYAGVDRGDFKSRIWRTTDYFATGTVIIDDIPLNNDPTIALSPANANYLFYGGEGGLRRYTVSSGDDIIINDNNPNSGATNVGLSGRSMISINANNANNLAFVDTADNLRVTANALSSSPIWVDIDGTTNARQCALVSDGQGAYAFGQNGTIYYTGNTLSTNTAASLKGNLSTAAAIIGIAGY